MFDPSRYSLPILRPIAKPMRKNVKMIRKFLKPLVMLLLVVSAALAQQPASTTPSVERIRQVITYLASDALEGRRTGSSGANDAAHYIAGEMNRLGLRPAMQSARPAHTRGENLARYLQPFPYVASVELGKNNSLVVKSHPIDGVQFRAGDDWMPLGFSSNGGIQGGQIVFVGYGITDSNLHYEDYGDVKGKIAVALKGTPDGDNPHGQFARFEDTRFKAVVARDHGAGALLIISSEEEFAEDRLTRLQYDNSAGDAGLPVVVISRKVAAKILGLGGISNLNSFEAEVQSAISGALKTEAKYYGYARTAKSANNVAGAGASLLVDLVRRESPSFNVIGVLPGSDPKLKDETIVIGAHYDHLGFGGEGSGSLSATTGIHHGADDNASGVAGLLELARMFASQNPKPRRTIVFIAFSGEEEGLIGSNYYVNHPILPLANAVAMINMDMIGRLKDDKLIIGGIGTSAAWREMVAAGNKAYTEGTRGAGDGSTLRVAER